MGTIIKAICECGFETRDMYLGGGMSGYIVPYGVGMSNHTAVCSFPNYCNSCKSLFVGNMLNDKIICTECKSKDTVPYNDSSLVKDLSKTSFEWNSSTKYGQLNLSKENSFCPKCENYSLEFRFVGMWD